MIKLQGLKEALESYFLSSETLSKWGSLISHYKVVSKI